MMMYQIVVVKPGIFSFREKMSGEALANRRQFIQGCFGGGTNVRPSISCIVSALLLLH